MSNKKAVTHAAIKRILCGVTAFVLLLALCPVMSAQAEETDAAAEQTVEIGIPVEENPELFLTRSMPTHGEGKIAIFLIDFPDYPNENPVATQEYYDKLYFSGSVETTWTGYVDTVAEYYQKQSYGKLNLSGYVFDWYTAEHERSYYDNKKAELVMEAAEYYRAQGIDFSQFDGDGDGVIDAITYHFAGEYSTDDQLNPWYYGVNYSMLGQIGDMKFSTIIQVNEDAKEDETDMITTVCHEMMHSLGMPDLYSGIFAVQRMVDDLMSVGNGTFINPYTKLLLGWVDNVKVITGDMDNVRLEAYGNESNDFVIVTDEFNGFFDEFYIVAYKELGSKAVIYHIDARLNESGTGFMNDNLSYNPRPDKPIHTHYQTFSPYLFIEELVGDPEMDFVLNLWATWIDSTEFEADSVLGPNAMPSSDMHDGEYTGIRIDNFKEHNDEYLTFDVAFVEDTASPVITTKEAELKFQPTVTVKFNEAVYAGERFDEIKITDPDGNILEASVILPNYPKNEMEINFTDKAYEDGYKVVIPDGALRDSSGNHLPAVTLTASREHYLFPIRSELLPGVGDSLNRDDYPTTFFEHENDVVVINPLWNEDYVYSSQIEFMRIDKNGNVLAQTIVDNPAKPTVDDFYRIYPIEMKDGSYIIFSMYQYDYTEYRVVFCIDANGNLKWVNDTYRDTPQYFMPHNTLIRENGIAVRLTERGKVGEAVFINSETGEIDLEPEWQSEATEWVQRSPRNLSDGRILCQQSGRDQSGCWYTELTLLDSETYEVEGKCRLAGTADDYYYVSGAQVNDDGTITMFCTIGEDAEGILLDATLNVVKSVSVGWTNYSAYNTVSWIKNDGFCVVYSTGGTVYEENLPYHVERYDRYLNLLWESDEEANFAFYFKSSAGDIMAYRCAFRTAIGEPYKCYVDYYGNEETLRGTHVHDLIHTEAVPATCQTEGVAEYWYCTDCGCYYAEGCENAVTDLQTLILPKEDHKTQEIPAKEAGCGWYGSTAGTRCTVCKKTLIYSENVPPTGDHSYGEWTVVREPNCKMAGTEQRKCSDCGNKEQREIPILDEHKFGDWKISKEPTVESEGEERRVCGVCGKDEVRSVAKLAAPTQETPDPEAPAPKQSSSWWVVLIIVGVGGAGAAIFLLKKKRS